ncbi:DUF5988 family protein [Streptomyces sp. TRM 70361]|uniref:DUF5988 family protein n=1 Tax=Streptomyces sp. TRM 70361 TaxID=3116553 RepID=UPI002E7C327C|nr:DUF5988 family protein [Streptomyces sp. TRM 70361]MEE1942781.1 DUF5988 family protein [Streptomyces sp. TRM 70361]
MSASAPNAFLRGGPDHCDHKRVRYVRDVRDTYKLPVGHAYEHFRPTDETLEHQAGTLRVFEWVTRTYVAE